MIVIIIGRVTEMIRMIMIIKIQRFIDIILALITHLYPPLCPSLSPFPLSVSSSLLSLPPLSSPLLNSPSILSFLSSSPLSLPILLSHLLSSSPLSSSPLLSSIFFLFSHLVSPTSHFQCNLPTHKHDDNK